MLTLGLFYVEDVFILFIIDVYSNFLNPIFIYLPHRWNPNIIRWFVGFYGMSTLIGLFYAEDILVGSFLMGTQLFCKHFT